MERITKEQQSLMEKWRRNNGACSFDYKNKDIILHDGGLFSIQKKKIKLHKIIGYKNLSNGYKQIIFSKKKVVKSEDYYAIVWMRELDEIVDYFRSMKRMLNKIGIKTDIPKMKNAIIRK